MTNVGVFGAFYSDFEFKNMFEIIGQIMSKCFVIDYYLRLYSETQGQLSEKEPEPKFPTLEIQSLDNTYMIQVVYYLGFLG